MKPKDATDAQVRALAGFVYGALLMSDSFRALFSNLMAGGSNGRTVVLALTEGGDNLTGVFASSKDEVVNANNGIGTNAVTYFNPNDPAKIQSRGNLVQQNPYATLAHELFHASQITAGRQSTDQATRENAATTFENRFRSEARGSDLTIGQQMGPRDCYQSPCQ